MNWLIIDEIIKRAIIEDMPQDDITTNSTISADRECEVDLIAKEDGIIAGLPVFERVFFLLNKVQVEYFVKEGQNIKSGQIIGKIRGNTRNILSGERVALNFLQRMSGIATLTSQYVKILEGTKTKLLDTRKTTPNFRIFEKYSVIIGGGCNHRYNLSDGVMLKDNHISAAGSIKNAVKIAREKTSFVRKIEVEVECMEQVTEAIEAKADIIMLDNMAPEVMTEAVKLINGRAVTEASGNITLKNIRKAAEAGVDFISIGALTHSYKALDLSMKNLKSIE